MEPELKQDWDSVTAEASSLVFGARGAIYNHPYDDYELVLEIFEALTGHDCLTVHDAAVFMQSVKLARRRYGYEQGFPPSVMRDHYVDEAGYADCAFGILVREHELNSDDSLAEFLDELDDE